ncbi:MAG: hypothetical protein FJ264_15090 [Planctomycetes bacterium]|nr:hypothetical protein [Planctomycetota bacterium]
MRNIKPLYISWFIAIAIIVIISVHYKKGTSTEFCGIAETREIIINSDRAVEVEKIYVLPGQSVNKGDPLVMLISRELDKEINDISYKLKELQAQYSVNKELVSELKSLQKYFTYANKTADQPPIHIKTEVLPQENHGDSGSDKNPFKTHIQRLERELELLGEEKQKLSVFSQIAGKIGAVLCRTGEQISPYDAILKIHTISPGHITGYIREDMSTLVYIGQKAKIVSVSNPSNQLNGEVVSVGHRTIKFPKRLGNWNRRSEPCYGREVLVKIPEDNRLLLGEKVIISIEHETNKNIPETVKNNFFPENNNSAGSEKYAINSNSEKTVAIKTDSSLARAVNIEASGIIYLKDLKKYLVISDTTQNNQLILYVMDNKGNIDDDVYIDGLNKIDDMEAIATDDEGNIFVTCSQSGGDDDDSGNIPDERKLLIKIKRNGNSFVLDKKVYLYDLLKAAAGKNKKAQWVQCITYRDTTIKINIEGMFYHEGSLYFGFKWPLHNEKAVVLKINNLQEVFEKELLEDGNIEFWKEFALQSDRTKTPAGISDLYVYKNDLYILSYCKVKINGENKKTGDLWIYDMREDALNHMRHFENLKPEGVAFNPDDNTLLLTFDHGHNHPSKIMELKVASSL